MVDIATEKVEALADCTKYVPLRRGQKRVHLATLYRWAERGCKGVKLEVLQVGGTKCSSAAALQRFFERLSAQANGEPVAPQGRTTRQRTKAAAKANAELQAAGW